MRRPTVAVLGAGSLGEIFAQGLLRAGWAADDLVLVSRRQARADDLARHTGLSSTTDAVAGVDGRDVIVISVKPRDVASAIESIREHVTADQTVVSLAAGVELATLEAGMPGQPIVRAMPNTPAAVDLGMTAMAPGSSAAEVDVDRAREVLGAVGETIELSEDLLDAVTAVSGTGPAYVFLLAETLIEAAIREGLPHHAAERLVHQTIHGSGELLNQSDQSAFKLRGQVTSPGGTTAAAMHKLEAGGFRALIEDAVRAATDRSRELGKRAAEE
jgi:pyrroline-5-carboxylate reductase